MEVMLTILPSLKFVECSIREWAKALCTTEREKHKDGKLINKP